MEYSKPKGPRLRVWEIQLEGPHLDGWPTPGHRTLYGDLEKVGELQWAVSSSLEIM